MLVNFLNGCLPLEDKENYKMKWLIMGLIFWIISDIRTDYLIRKRLSEITIEVNYMEDEE